MKGADKIEGEEEQREGCALKRIQEIRDRGARFQQRKVETRHLLLETAEAMDKVTREEQWGTTGTTGASILGGVLTVAGGALTIAAMTAAAPLLVAGTVVGVAGGLGGIAKNILVGKKKSAQQSGAELAMENLRKLEEEYKQAAIELAMEMEEMTEEQRKATHEMLALSKNTSVRSAVKSVLEDSAFKSVGETKGYRMKAMGTASLVLGATTKTMAKEISEEVLEMSAKSFGKVAGGVVVGVSALFLISDGVTITKTAMRLWRKEPSKAAEMLRELASRLSEGEEAQTPGPGTWNSDLSCPVCWDPLTALEGERTVLATPCGHLFCSTCLAGALQTSSSCPNCRSTVTLKSCNRIYLS